MPVFRKLLSTLLVCGALTAQQRWTLRGRVVADEDGRPLSGATVTVTGHQATGHPLHWSWLDWCDPEPVTTGAGGAFVFSLPPQPGRGRNDGYPSRLHVVVSAPGRVSTFGHWFLSRFFVEAEQDVRDVRLPIGREVRVLVCDEARHPLAGRVVRLHPGATPAGRGAWYWPLRVLDSAPSEANGIATFAQPLAAGTWSVDAPGEQVLERPPLEIGPSSAAIVDGQIVVKRGPERPVTAGRIVDDHGEPLGGRELLATWNLGRSDESLSFRTSADGSFRIDRFPARLEEFSVLEVGSDHLRDARWPGLRVGDGAVRLEVVPQSKLRIEVRLPAGANAERFAVHALPQRTWPGMRTLRTVLHAKDGVLEIDGLGAGPWAIRVHAIGTELWPSPWTECEVPAKNAPVVRFAAPVERRVFVFTEEGRPVVDGRVELVFGRARDVVRGRQADTADWRDPVYDRTMTGPPGPLRSPMIVLADRRRTDRSGCATLRGLATDEPVCVRVRGGGAVDTVVELPSFGITSEVLRLTVAGAGEVRGVVRGGASMRRPFVCTDGERRGAAEQGAGPDPWGRSLDDLHRRVGSSVVMRRVGAHSWIERRAVWSDAGEFRLDSVEPGTWDVRIADHERDAKGNVVEVERAGVGARIEVVAGQVCEVELVPPAMPVEPPKR